MIEELEKQYRELEAKMMSYAGKPGSTHATSRILFEMRQVYRKLKVERLKVAGA